MINFFLFSKSRASSVYNMVNTNLETLQKSFIYKMNISGPKIDTDTDTDKDLY